ncbi:MAG: NADH-quinone oxidoreductase subunit N [Anaerolineae bacterium]|nr:NADH-quinone oxidoreductase subunit N [Anaerolineae bacterium]
MIPVPSLSDFNLQYTLPALSITVWAAILLVIDLFIPRERKQTTAWLAAGGVVFAFVANAFLFNVNEEAFLGMFRADQFTAYVNAVILGTAFIGILMSVDYLKRTQIERGEYYVLMLFSAAGMMFMAAANDLIAVFVALELLSIPLYVLSAFRAPDTKSEESGLKYFILGAFASAFLVYGAALIYGATGTTNIPAIFAAIGEVAIGGSASILLLIGAGLMLVGLGFKVAAVPFHMWTPDVYEGAPTPITAFMSVGAKAGGFAALFRVLASALPTFVFTDGSIHAVWQASVWILAAATLILGNLVAIAQSNIKRMLAYSSIAHAGYILMAVAAAGTAGIGDAAARAALFYLMAYMFTNLGAFAIAMSIEKDDGSGTNISDFTGLSKSRPGLAAMMAFFMLSLTGFPPTAGFVAKFLVFQETLNAGLVPLAIIGVITSVISGYYYLNIVVKMFLGDGEGDPAAGATPYLRWAAYACFAGTLILFVLPFLGTDLANSINLAVALAP